MTNYNERLEYILSHLANKVEWCVNPELLSRATVDREKEDEAINEAKQALASLIKELVSEAKPKDYTPEGHHPDACLNHEKYTSSCRGCQKQRARTYALGEYQYNLLKALEEV